MRTAIERLWSRIRYDQVTGCWINTGSDNGRGYCQIRIDGRKVPAHRFSFETYREPIPPELETDHLCRVRRCMNPWHMEPVTHRINVLRSDGIAAREARKTHCLRGHEFTSSNIRFEGRKRKCRTCERLRAQERRA